MSKLICQAFTATKFFIRIINVDHFKGQNIKRALKLNTKLLNNNILISNIKLQRVH